MAAWLRDAPGFREPDRERLDEATGRALAPLRRSGAGQEVRRNGAGRVADLRDRLATVMWDKVGILRTGRDLADADAALADLGAELAETGAGSVTPAYNPAWHDWLNLENLILVSRAIILAAQTRQGSLGAQYRCDFPEPGNLAAFFYTEVRLQGDVLAAANRPVRYTRVRPAEETGQ